MVTRQEMLRIVLCCRRIRNLLPQGEHCSPLHVLPMDFAKKTYSIVCQEGRKRSTSLRLGACLEQEGFDTLWICTVETGGKQMSTGPLQFMVQIPPLLQRRKKKHILADVLLFFWRSRRDLNPRYPFGVHTISSRARYDHFDTAPCVRLSCRLRYDTTWI